MFSTADSKCLYPDIIQYILLLTLSDFQTGADPGVRGGGGGVRFFVLGTP